MSDTLQTMSHIKHFKEFRQLKEKYFYTQDATEQTH